LGNNLSNWRIVGFYLMPLALALAVFVSVKFKTDLSAFVIAGDNAEEILLASEMQSGALSRRYLLAIGPKNQHPVSEAFLYSLKMQLKAIKGVTEVWSPGYDADVPDTLSSLYGAYAGVWYSLEPERDLAQLFSDDGLKQRAELLKKALLSPQATLIKKLAIQDPLLLILNGFKAQGQQMQQALKKGEAYRNLIVETTMTGLDVPQQKRIQTEMNAIFNTLNQAEDAPKSPYQLEMTGVPVFAVATQTLIQGDIQTVSLVSTIGLVLLFMLIFRSLGSLAQVTSILLVAMLAAMLITQAIFGYVHGMTMAIGSTLVGICIDYPIHAIAHAQTVRQEHRLAVIATIWPSIVLGGFTTLVGYVVLGALGYPGFKQVAVFSASGIIISLLLTRYVLPGLLKSQRIRPLNIPLVSAWVGFCQRFRPGLVGLLLIGFIISLVGLKSLHWMEDMQELTPELNYLKQIDKRIRKRITSIEPGRFVMVSADNIDAALEKSEAVYKALGRLKQAQKLTEYYGLYPWLLSKQQQERNQTLLQGYLSPENLARWQKVLTQHGLSVEKLGHFNYPKAAFLSVNQVMATPVKKLIDSRVIQGEHEAIAMIWLADHQPEAVKAALPKMAGVQYFSQRDLFNNMTHDYMQRAEKLLLMGLTVILLLMISRYRNIPQTLQALLPAIVSALMILGFLSLNGTAINFLHLVGFLLVVSIGVDYGIFYLENRGEDIALTYQAMGAAMLTSALAFASLMVSDSTSLKMLSGVVVFGVVLSFLLCPVIIKPNHQPVE
jgi:predicted exporter